MFSAICYVAAWLFFIGAILMLFVAFLSELFNFRKDRRPFLLRVFLNPWAICGAVDLIIIASIYFCVRG